MCVYIMNNVLSLYTLLFLVFWHRPVQPQKNNVNCRDYLYQVVMNHVPKWTTIYYYFHWPYAQLAGRLVTVSFRNCFCAFCT